MRKFILKIVIFFLPIIFLAASLEFSLRLIPNEYLYKKKYLDANSNEINTLILGASGSYFGINPIYFVNNTFNASHISQSPDLDFKILKKYENKLKCLKTIVLQVSYITFYFNLAKSIESWRAKNYVLYYQINATQSYRKYSELLSNKININFRKIYSYYIKRDTSLPCSKLGWGTGYISENTNDLIETGKTAALRHTVNINTDKYMSIFRENYSVLDSIIEWSGKKNIRVILITFPAFETYRQNLNSDQLWATIKAANELDNKYDNCSYFNLLNDTTFVAKDFHDADHLSEIGAKKLSIKINDLIVNAK